jgi:rubrerythrin
MKTKLMLGIMIILISSGLLIGCYEKDTSVNESQVILNLKSENEEVTNAKEQVFISKDDNLTSFGAKAANEDLNLTKEAMLTYAMQDEYLARKEYELIMDKYGEQKPFSNIIKAEEEHISMLTELFNEYKIYIPEDKSKDYIVVPNTLNESYEAGIKAEIENIDMYERFLSAFEKNASEEK